MLRELREEIVWLRGQRNRKHFKCRDTCPTKLIDNAIILL
jgi:hypothetical protein